MEGLVNGRTSQVGRCGGKSPVLVFPPGRCFLPAGHNGSHRGDDGSEWTTPHDDHGQVEKLETGIAAAVHEIDELRAENVRLRAPIAGHTPDGTRNGLNACTCGIATSGSWEQHVVDSIQRDVIRRTAVDTCSNCGDLVITYDGECWSHYQGPGQVLNRCQHTVPYGVDATPAHDGAYAKRSLHQAG